jgi:hypothetical protein
MLHKVACSITGNRKQFIVGPSLSSNTLFNARLYANHNNPFIGIISKRDYTTDQFQKRTILIVDRRRVVGEFRAEICATSVLLPSSIRMEEQIGNPNNFVSVQTVSPAKFRNGGDIDSNQ